MAVLARLMCRSPGGVEASRWFESDAAVGRVEIDGLAGERLVNLMHCTPPPSKAAFRYDRLPGTDKINSLIIGRLLHANSCEHAAVRRARNSCFCAKKLTQVGWDKENTSKRPPKPRRETHRASRLIGHSCSELGKTSLVCPAGVRTVARCQLPAKYNEKPSERRGHANMSNFDQNAILRGMQLTLVGGTPFPTPRIC